MDLATLCKEVCEEFKAQGFNVDIDPRTLKESYNILKQPNGAWFKNTKPGLHEAAVQDLIDFNQMPLLKKLTDLIDEMDSEIHKKGGRVFITENLVYKITKGSESPIVSNFDSRASGAYRKLCDEIIDRGLDRDRYRTEETYMLTKDARGEWSMTISHENHSGTKKTLNLAEMPQLKALATKINKSDSQFQTNGGRIFITPTRIYRLKNKIEMNFKF